MKNLIVVILSLLFTHVGFTQGDSISAKKNEPLPAYRRFPTPPPFKLLETDSVTIFSKANLEKKKPLLVILFNPDCEHCQHETEEIIKHIDAFEKIQIVMASNAPFSLIRSFYHKYEISKFPNIKVGQDFQSILPSFYMIRNFPYLAMYDKKGKLLTTFEGAMKIEDILKIFD